MKLLYKNKSEQKYTDHTSNKRKRNFTCPKGAPRPHFLHLLCFRGRTAGWREGWGEERRRAAGLGCYRHFLPHCDYFLYHYCCYCSCSCCCLLSLCCCCSPQSLPVSRPQSTPPSPLSLPSLGPPGWGNGREGPRVRTEARKELWWSQAKMVGKRPEEASQLCEWCHENWPKGGASARHCVLSPRWLFGADEEEEIRDKQSRKGKNN